MQDLVAAGLWALAVVPAAIGFWLVAGSLAGVTTADADTLIVGSLLGLALATLLQVLLGFRLPMYEGPSSAYLAAITVITANHHHGLTGVTGGLLGAGVFVCFLAVLRVDRLMMRMFTPLVANVFVLVVTIAVVPATLERMIGSTHGFHDGNVDALVSSFVVVVTILLVRRIPRLTPYSLLAGLLAGTAVQFALAGVPDTNLSGGLVAPTILPWGSPDISASVLITFALAGTLAAFNTIASGMVAATEHGLPERAHSSSGRAFVMHGASQAGGALVGMVLGNVSRLDSVGITRLLGNARRAPLVDRRRADRHRGVRAPAGGDRRRRAAQRLRRAARSGAGDRAHQRGRAGQSRALARDAARGLAGADPERDLDRGGQLASPHRPAARESDAVGRHARGGAGTSCRRLQAARGAVRRSGLGLDGWFHGRVRSGARQIKLIKDAGSKAC